MPLSIWEAPLHRLPRQLPLPDTKATTRDLPIEVAALPTLLRLPLTLHGGREAEPCVEVGARVQRGSLIARGAQPLDAAIHASSSGRIIAIHRAPLPCIELEADGDDSVVEASPRPGWRDLSRAQLLELLATAGVAGLGGAGFPSAVKLAAAGDGVDLLLINAAECEPMLTADERLLAERSDEVLAGVEILAWLCAARRVVIAIEDDKTAAITALRAASCAGEVQLAVIPRQYPSGSERQLLHILTGIELDRGRLPLQAGMLCFNVATAWAAGRAILHGEPLVSRIVTVTGSAVLHPGNLQVRLGTPVGDLLAQRGLDGQRLDTLRLGGPLTGRPIADRRWPIGKTDAGLLAAGPGETGPPGPEMPCIRCGACAEVCPVALLPQELERQGRAGDLDALRALHLPDCIECGACAWVCPSAIPLLDRFRDGKAALRAEAARQADAERARLRHERRERRLQAEREAAEQARQQRLSRVEAALARARQRQSEP